MFLIPIHNLLPKNKMAVILTSYILTSILANTVYAIARAKNNDDEILRMFAFVYGLPVSVLTYVAVKEGSNRAYGINLAFLD